MRDNAAAGGQDVLEHSQIQWKAKVKPHGISDDLGWKATVAM